MKAEEDAGRAGAERPDESVFSSFGRTVRDIVANVQEIIRSEVQLAKTEVKEEVAGLKKVGVFYGATAICGMYALGFILLAIVYGLSAVVRPWLAAGIVGAGMAIFGGIAFFLARKQMRELSFRTEQTIETAKENVQWAKTRFK